jgi:hypothetical protein
MKRRNVLVLLQGGIASMLEAWAAPLRIVKLPQHKSNLDPQLGYVSDLVRLALAKLGDNAEVRLVPLEMQQRRSLAELSSGRSTYDLMWSMTDVDREKSGLLPVRIPIDRGLLGWRLLLVRTEDLPRWSGVGTLAQLRRFVAGQGHDWPDLTILKANGLPVVSSHAYDALFRMLKASRFDYVPRSILEIDTELAGSVGAGLSIIPNLMLCYPAAAYLFVSPALPRLAADLEQGLELAIADGSFKRLFDQRFGKVVAAHPVQAERVLYLNNPLLPPSAPTTRRELWLRPGVGVRPLT